MLNASPHAALGRSPFEALYGHARHFGISRDSISPVPDVASMLAERSTVLAAVHQHLLRAQQRMKHQADKRGCEPSFNIDDYVYLRL